MVSSKNKMILLSIIALILIAGIIFPVLLFKSKQQESYIIRLNQLFFEKTMSHLGVVTSPGGLNSLLFPEIPTSTEFLEKPELIHNLIKPMEGEFIFITKEKIGIIHNSIYKDAELFLSKNTNPGDYFNSHQTGTTELFLSQKIEQWVNPARTVSWYGKKDLLFTKDPESLILFKFLKPSGLLDIGDFCVWSKEENFHFLYKFQGSKGWEKLPVSQMDIVREPPEKSYFFEILNGSEMEEPLETVQPWQPQFLLIRLDEGVNLKTMKEQLQQSFIQNNLKALVVSGEDYPELIIKEQK